MPKPPPIPFNEAQRLNALQEYQILDTASEQAFDDLTQLASNICETPIAMISLVDEKRQWFKSKVGVSVAEAPREISFCAHAILEKDLFIVPDATKDDRFSSNPFVVGAPNVRFYAGALLSTPSGDSVGTLCVIDKTPRKLTDRQLSALRIIARQVVCQMELRKAFSVITTKKASEMALHENRLQFIANVTREIGPPMNVIRGMSNFLKGTPLDREQAKYLQHIEESVENMSSLIKDILDLSKLDSGKLTIDETDFELKPVIEQAINLVEIRAKQKGLALKVDYENEIPEHFRGDSDRLRQVLLNLLGNAIKFTEKGKVLCRVKRGETKEHFGKLLFCVSDTGVGMSESKRAELFQKRSNDVTVIGSMTGTPLGLHISKQLVDLMGGTIWVDSKEGAGTQVIFALPVKEVDRKQVTSVSKVVYIEPPPREANDPVRMLVVDDSRDQQRLMKSILDVRSFQLETAETGQKALERFMTEQYDIVLMDIEMPFLDGYSTTRLMRKWERENKKFPTPIVAITNTAFPEEQDRANEAGCTDFLTKPFSKKNLMEMVDRLMKRVPAAKKVA